MRVLAAVACLGLLAATAVSQDAAEENAGPRPLPRIMRADFEEGFAAALLRLEEAAERAESAAPKRGFWHRAGAWFRREELPRAVPLEALVAQPEDLAGELVEAEGFLLPDESDALVPLLAGDESQTRLRFNLADGASLPRMKTDEGKVLPTPLVVTGNVIKVLQAGDEGKPEYALDGAEARLAPAPLRFRIGLLYEAREKGEEKAVGAYTSAFEKTYRTHELAPMALYRAAQIADQQYSDERQGDKRAAKIYSAMWTSYVQGRQRLGPPVTVLVQQDGEVRALPVKDAIGESMDELNSRNILYRIMQYFALACGGSGAWGVLLLALVTRVLMFPLSKKQVVAQRGLQKLQPELKRIQEKYKDDKVTQQKKMMELYREQGVSMFGGCLPLLIQMPILIALYMGIRMYIYQFSQQGFLWMPDLSAPDMPLLIAYTISMVVFQKIQAKSTPATDPQQQQMQRTMTWMMPIMFFFIFQSFPAAFILYWLGTNVIYAGQQYWLSRGLEAPESAQVASMKPAPEAQNPAQAEQGAAEGSEEEPAAQEPPPAPSPKQAPKSGPRSGREEQQSQRKRDRQQQRKLKKEQRRRQRLRKQQKRRRGRG